MQGGKGAACLGGIGIRSKVLRTVRLNHPGEEGTGEILLSGDFDIGITLVVLQFNVTGRKVFFDQIEFQQQGFRLIVGDDVIHLLHPLDEWRGITAIGAGSAT